MVFVFFVLWALLEFWVISAFGVYGSGLCFLTRPGATTRGSGGPRALSFCDFELRIELLITQDLGPCCRMGGIRQGPNAVYLELRSVPERAQSREQHERTLCLRAARVRGREGFRLCFSDF